MSVAKFIYDRVKEYQHESLGWIEEQVICEVVEEFGPPADGDTDWLRMCIKGCLKALKAPARDLNPL